MFGARRLGEGVEETVVIRSRSQRSFTVTGIKSEMDGLSVQPIQFSGGEEKRFRVKQQITKSLFQKHYAARFG
jgi:hypothetical protein